MSNPAIASESWSVKAVQSSHIVPKVNQSEAQSCDIARPPASHASALRVIHLYLQPTTFPSLIHNPLFNLSSHHPILKDKIPANHHTKIMARTQTVSAYQTRVYTLLQQIPAGRVTTYAALAAALNSSPRAVGGALRNNPFAPEVPCHRCIASSGVSRPPLALQYPRP